MVGLAVLSLLVLAALEWDWFGPEQDRQLLYADLGIVLVFWVEYAARWVRAPRRAAFVRANWYELPGMVPIFPGMEAYAGVRFFRLLRLFRILRLLGFLRRFDRVNALVRRFTVESRLGYIALLAFLLIGICAGVVWVAEPETFPTFGDALWWGIVTATTVGYGDFYPRTGLARAAGVVLMLLGVGLIGSFAATLSSFLVERRRRGARAAEALAERAGIASELERLDRLRRSGALTASEFAQAKRRLLR